MGFVLYASDFRFRVSGFRFSGVVFRVSCFGFRISVPNFGLRVVVPSFRFRFRVPCSGIRVPVFRSRLPDFWFRASTVLCPPVLPWHFLLILKLTCICVVQIQQLCSRKEPGPTRLVRPNRLIQTKNCSFRFRVSGFGFRVLGFRSRVSGLGFHRYVCMYIHIYVLMYNDVYVCLCIYIYTCLYVYMYTCMYLHVNKHIHI